MRVLIRNKLYRELKADVPLRNNHNVHTFTKLATYLPVKGLKIAPTSDAGNHYSELSTSWGLYDDLYLLDSDDEGKNPFGLPFGLRHESPDEELFQLSHRECALCKRLGVEHVEHTSARLHIHMKAK